MPVAFLIFLLKIGFPSIDATTNIKNIDSYYGKAQPSFSYLLIIPFQEYLSSAP